MKVICNSISEFRVVRKALKDFRNKPAIEDQTKNGVKVKVYHFNDGSTKVESDCNCLGSLFRCHSNYNCPNMERI